MLIIGLIGQKRVGKDTVASIIKKYFGNRDGNGDGNRDGDGNVFTYALADPIKDIARIMFNFEENQLYGHEKDVIDSKWGIKPRDFFEKFGTEIMQYDIYNYLPGLKDTIPERKFWVLSLLNKLKHHDNNSIIIITDIRGLHELEEIQKLNSYNNNKVKFIKIIRDVNILYNIPTPQTHITHITQIEAGLIPNNFIDYHIHNNGSLTDLENQTIQIINDINSNGLIQ